jgi:hypothetical protein
MDRKIEPARLDMTGHRIRHAWRPGSRRETIEVNRRCFTKTVVLMGLTLGKKSCPGHLRCSGHALLKLPPIGHDFLKPGR